MKKAEISVGKVYRALVNGGVTDVRVDDIDGNNYRVTNLKTGRTTLLRSAAKFRTEVHSGGAHTLAGPSAKPSPASAVAVAAPLASVIPSPSPAVAPASSGLASRLRSADSLRSGIPHLIVEARAGTGKTTTLVEGLRRVMGGKSNLVPSPQQAAVWDAMALSAGVARSICFVAFNKAIAEELKRRVPEGCEAMTMHSMGLKSVTAAFGKVQITGYRVQDIMGDILGKDIREVRKESPVLVNSVESLVGLCKVNLIDSPDDTELDRLASYYDIDLNGSRSKAFALVPQILERCKDVNRDKRIDFNDMIWLPVALNLPILRYDLLLVDEAQDLNHCQQSLAKRAGKRLILCGDPKQAIYGFAGADSQSMSRMETELRDDLVNPSAGQRGCVTLPLTVTRRCGKAIVREAQKLVPDFEAFHTNPDGKVAEERYASDNPKQTTYHATAKPGDMVVCRVNAPLVSQCFKFIRMGHKANIQGRDIGQGLISTVKKLMKGFSAPDGLSDTDKGKVELVELFGRLDTWLSDESAKETAKKNPNESRLIALKDRYDCLLCFCEEQKSVEGVIAKIEAIFTDDKDKPGIRLSSIHKSKGLESDRVYFLLPKGGECPHPMAKSAWQKEQENNLYYVAVTRAISELVFVR